MVWLESAHSLQVHATTNQGKMLVRHSQRHWFVPSLVDVIFGYDDAATEKHDVPVVSE